MNRFNRAVAVLTVACGLLLAGGPVFGQDQNASKLKFISPIRGVADIEVAPPVSVVKGNQIITTIKVKNVSGKPIAGLKCDAVWWDKAAKNPVPGGGTFMDRNPLMPGQILTITITSERDPRMAVPRYQFSHAYGQINAKSVKKIEGGDDK
jgi:hypothetical protein